MITRSQFVKKQEMHPRFEAKVQNGLVQPLKWGRTSPFYLESPCFQDALNYFKILIPINVRFILRGKLGSDVGRADYVKRS